jgi:hypothetical protein
MMNRVKAFLWKWGVTLISFGIYQGEVVYECVDCGRFIYEDEGDCDCIFMQGNEDIN